MLQKGPGGGYFLASRPFELAELKLLAGAVQASKFLSERKSVALIEKLSTLCSSYQAAQLEPAGHRPRPRQVDERKHLLYRRPDT